MSAGKILIAIGLAMVIIGSLIQFGFKFPFPGRLPGDFVIEKGNFRIYIPLATSVLVSLLITVLMVMIHRFRN